MVGRDDGPAIRQLANVPPASIDHGFDRENHACLQQSTRSLAPIMKHLGVFMEISANTMATKLPDDAIPGIFSKSLDGVPNVPQTVARAHLPNAEPHGLIGYRAQTLRLFPDFTNLKHAAGITMETILDDRDVNIDDIAVLERPGTRYAVANLVVDRGAYGTGIGRMSRRAVVKGGGNRMLDIDHVIVTQAIQFPSGDTNPDVRFDEIQNFGGQVAGGAHALDFFGRFDGSGHESKF